MKVGTRLNPDERIAEWLRERHDSNSHVEPDSHTFHPSHLSRCKRYAYLKKFGLVEYDEKSLGRFAVGDMFHRKIQYEIFGEIDNMQREAPAEKQCSDIHITGHADMVDWEDGVVWDIKTKQNWYGFKVRDRHYNQLQLYMHCFGLERAKLIYVKKGDWTRRITPKNEFIEYSKSDIRDLLKKGSTIRREIEQMGRIAQEPDEIPFDKCPTDKDSDNYCIACDNEELVFENIPELQIRQ